VEYQELRPPASLRPFVKCIWTLRGVSDQTAPQRIMPDGSVELVLHFSGTFRRHEPDGTVVEQPRALVVGIVDRWMMLESTGAIDILGVRFRPGAVRGVLGVTQANLAGRCHDLSSLCIDALDGLLPQARDETEPERRVALVLAHLARAAEVAVPPHATVLHTARRIVATAGRAPIQQIAEGAGWSLRHLERQFRREVGVTAKEFARLSRFHGVVTRLKRGQPPRWSRLAAQAGYHDQSHLVRDFREFGGTTPAAFWRETHPLSDLFHTSVEFLQDEAGTTA